MGKIIANPITVPINTKEGKIKPKNITIPAMDSNQSKLFPFFSLTFNLESTSHFLFYSKVKRSKNINNYPKFLLM
ncbi:hypothetical protein [Phocicoccus pinnipedialis]|uniref:hypothetical protein n=1 Tax=Phocicoccus pinnipedialis TaxID=110845 RepID=UPI00366F23E6